MSYQVLQRVTGRRETRRIELPIVPWDKFAASTLAIGSGQSAAITTAGLYVTGGNAYGALGLGDYDQRLKFVHVPDVQAPKHISSTGQGISYVDTNGRIWTAGETPLSEWGYENVFEEITAPQSLVQVFESDSHALVLAADGKVYGAGDNWHGQLGQGTYADYYANLTLVPGLPSVKQIAVGMDISAVLSTDGKVYVCGQNTRGSIGLGPGSYDPECGDEDPGFVGIDMVTTFTEITRPTLPKIKYIAIGNLHLCAVSEAGELWVTGNNDGHGRLGTGDLIDRLYFTKIEGLPPVQAVAAGMYHTMILLEDGTIMGTGSNMSGQLGLSYQDNFLLFTPIPGLSNVVEVSCGPSASMAKNAAGKIYVTGNGFAIGINSMEVQCGFVEPLFLPVGEDEKA